jgi:haloalkane dehalogenase
VAALVKAYRTPDERFAALTGYDFAPRYVEQDGLRMHYVDEGEGAPCCCSTASRRGRTCIAR